jgi:hypothetical protein
MAEALAKLVLKFVLAAVQDDAHRGKGQDPR